MLHILQEADLVIVDENVNIQQQVQSKKADKLTKKKKQPKQKAKLSDKLKEDAIKKRTTIKNKETSVDQADDNDFVN